MNNERIRLGEWEFGDQLRWCAPRNRLRIEKDPVKSQLLKQGQTLTRQGFQGMQSPSL